MAMLLFAYINNILLCTVLRGYKISNIARQPYTKRIHSNFLFCFVLFLLLSLLLFICVIWIVCPKDARPINGSRMKASPNILWNKCLNRVYYSFAISVSRSSFSFLRNVLCATNVPTKHQSYVRRTIPYDMPHPHLHRI